MVNREPQLPRWEIDEDDVYVVYEVGEAADVTWWWFVKWLFKWAILPCVAILLFIWIIW